MINETVLHKVNFDVHKSLMKQVSKFRNTIDNKDCLLKFFDLQTFTFLSKQFTIERLKYDKTSLILTTDANILTTLVPGLIIIVTF